MIDDIETPSTPLTQEASTDGIVLDAYARALCRHHAAALLTLAEMILDDVDAGSDIVVGTIVAACREPQPVASDVHTARTRLARSVYRRCLGRLTTRERFAQLEPPPPTGSRHSHSPVAHLTANQRAMLALVLFGGHDIEQIARTLRTPMSVIAEQLPGVLRRVEVGTTG